MTHKMKKIVFICLDFLAIIVGILFIPIGFLKWRHEDYILNFSGQMASFEGNMGFCLMLLGIALIGYSVFDIKTFRISPPDIEIYTSGVNDRKIIRSFEQNEKEFNKAFIMFAVIIGASLILIFAIDKLL